MKTAIISTDGQNIVIIDDYSGGFALQELEILTFYQRDQKIKSLKLGEILENMCSVTYSASHMHWCTSNFKFNVRNEFSINTNEFYMLRDNVTAVPAIGGSITRLDKATSEYTLRALHLDHIDTGNPLSCIQANAVSISPVLLLNQPSTYIVDPNFMNGIF